MADIPIETHRLMALQHGNVSLQQLLDSGLTRNRLKHLLRCGWLLDAGRNVYRSPSVTVTEQSRCAALCLGRPEIVVTGPTAGRIWGFRKVGKDRRIHLLMPPHAHSVQPHSSLVARRTSTLDPIDVVHRRDGIRVTSRRRTCLELARSLDGADLLSVTEQALLDGRLTEADMRGVAIGMTFGRPWVRQFLGQLDRRLAGAPAESDPEVRLGLALEEHGLNGLVRQHRLTLESGAHIRFDLAIPEIRWAVEIDLFPTHQQTDGGAADAKRDVAAAALGWTVRRVTPKAYTTAFASTVVELVEDAASTLAEQSR